MNFAPVTRVIGFLLLTLAALMIIPMMASFAEAPVRSNYFLLAFTFSVLSGMALAISGATSGPFELDRRQSFLITAGAWIIVPGFACIPLLAYKLSFTDAFFEAVSGMTTTGATVMSGLDTTSASILLWRSILQWIGGVGIVVMAITIMPFLRVGGMQLFRTESSEKSESIVAGSFALTRWILTIYALITFCAIITYKALGMTWFDALNHSFTTVSTGGFSTHDASFGYFNTSLQWAAIIFMASGAFPFIAYIRLAHGKAREFSNDIQLRGFLVFIIAASVFVALSLMQTAHLGWAEALRAAAFNVVSIVTTTGYASADYQAWGPFAIGTFFILTFVGGCTGSTSGGIKIYRFQVLGRLARAFLAKMVRPSRVISVLYHGRKVEDEVAYAILAFMAVLLFSLAASTLALTYFGIDLVTALTASATCITNVGPGLGAIVGPAGNFSTLPDGAKWILSLMMILGRLEFFTMLVLLVPDFWER